MIYRFRVILDTEEDIFRDIEIEADSNLEEFHDAITQSFGFDGSEMASFYTANEFWEEEDEIALFDMGETPGETRIMRETPISDVVSEDEPRLIYVYDFLSMWTFMVELGEVSEREDGKSYPNLMFSHGHIPDTAPEKEFSSESIDSEEDDFNDMFDEDFDLDPEDYEDLGFDENWN